jgi:hypothetical protein
MPIPLTVSGIDANGHIFRERTVVQGLEGRDCQYQSAHEMRVDSIVLLDLDYSAAGQPPCRVQGRIKSLRTPQKGPGVFQIDVELDTLQSLRIVPHDREVQVGKQDTSLQAPMAAAPEPKGVAAIEAPRHDPVPPVRESGEALSQPCTGLNAEAAENRELPAGIGAHNLTIVREAAEAAEVSEISGHQGVLRNSLTGEIETCVQAALVPVIEKMVHDAVGKQIAAKYEAGIQALHADLTSRLAERLSESEDLRRGLKEMAAELAKRLNELSQSTATKVERDLNARAAAIRQSIEETIAEAQDRINDTRTGLGATLSRVQVVDNEANKVLARVQEAVAQAQEADRIAVEASVKRLSSQLDAWGAEFDKRLDQVSVERTTRWVSGVERQMLPTLQRADQALEMLEAGLQLAQIQEGRLAAFSQTAMADFEKEIRSLFLHLSSSA